jgi:hypothetical protein
MVSFSRVAAAAALLLAVSATAADAKNTKKNNENEWMSLPALSPELVDRVNADPQSPWQAALNDRFRGLTLGDAAKLCGARAKDPKLADRSQWSKELTAKRAAFTEEMRAKLPADFDSRKAWPGCIHPILNQGQCGRCGFHDGEG